MRKIIEPKATHGIVSRKTDGWFNYQGWPTVARDENGVLYAVTSGHRIAHICPYGKTLMYTSKDDGATWSKPTILNDTFLDDRDAGILYMGNGRMLVTWFTHSTEAYLNLWNDWIRNEAPEAMKESVSGQLNALKFLPKEESDGGSYIIVSEDYGYSWSKAIRLPVSAPHGPIMLSDGTLFYFGKEMYAADIVGRGAICAYCSSDGGYTWEKRSTLQEANGLTVDDYDEPYAIELKDGSILGVLRSDNGAGMGLTHYSCFI